MNMRVKTIPEDFTVSEVLSSSNPVDLQSSKSKYQLFCLKKRGYSTFEAIDILSTNWGVASNSIGFAGLKDEEGCTTQTISVETTNSEVLSAFNSTKGTNFIQVHFIGYSSSPLAIASNLGNAFQIIVRDMNQEQLIRLKKFSGRGRQFTFANYYDDQRFGLPNQPKLTHLLGEYFLNERLDKLPDLLLESGLVDKPVMFESSDELLEIIHPRQVSFWLCSFESFLWNQKVSDKMPLSEKKFDNQVQKLNVHSSEIITSNEHIPLKKYSFENGELCSWKDNRPSFITTHVQAACFENDKFHNGKYSAQLKFFLPAGCYATTLVKQLAL